MIKWLKRLLPLVVISCMLFVTAASAATNLSLTGKNITVTVRGAVGNTAVATVTVTDGAGAPIANETVTFSTTQGTLQSTTAVTDGSGVATATVTGLTGGETIVTATLGDGGSASAPAFGYADFSNNTLNGQLSLSGLSDSDPGVYAPYDVRAHFVESSIMLNNKQWNPGYGVALYGKPISLAANKSFSTAFTFDIQGAADNGFAFFLSKDITTAVGYDSTDKAIGLPKTGTNAIVEFDTKQNSGQNDADANHIGFDTVSGGSITYGQAQELALKLANKSKRYVWIDYNGAADTLTVSVAATADRTTAETMTVAHAGIASLLTGDTVHAGFVSTIYDTTSRTDIDSWYFNSEYAPIAQPQGAVLGDLNGDGTVDQTDLDLVNAGISAGTAWTAAQLAVIDLNKDGVVNSTDTQNIQNIIDSQSGNTGSASDTMNNLVAAIQSKNSQVFRCSVWQNGTYLEHYFMNLSACQNVYSVSKVITSTAVGLAYDRGLLNLDDPIVNYLGDHLPDTYSANLSKVTVRNLLTQTTGIANGNLFETDRYTTPSPYGDDWVKRELALDIPYEPGTTFTYSNSNYFLLACIVEKVSGMSLDMFLKKNLFGDMGIQEFSWERSPEGHIMGATGCYMRLDDMNKIGQLYLNNGVYGGKQLLSKAYVTMATTPYANNSGTPYGFGFLKNSDGDVFVNGANGQMIYFSKAYNAVVAIQGFQNDFATDILAHDVLRQGK